MSMAKEVEIHVRINAIVTWSSGFWVIAAPLNVGIQCIQKKEKHLVLWNQSGTSNTPNGRQSLLLLHSTLIVL